MITKAKNTIPSIVLEELKDFANDIEIQSDFVEQGIISECEELTYLHVWNDLGSIRGLINDIKNDIRLIDDMNDKHTLNDLNNMLEVFKKRYKELTIKNIEL